MVHRQADQSYTVAKRSAVMTIAEGFVHSAKLVFLTSVASPRPESQTKHICTRFTSSLSIFALLMCSLFVLDTSPVQAQIARCPDSGVVGSGTLTTGDGDISSISVTGYLRGSVNPNRGELSNSVFTHDRVAYTIRQLTYNASADPDFNDFLVFRAYESLGSNTVKALALHINGSLFHFANATRVESDTLRWNNAGLSWTRNQAIDFCITEPVVTLSVAPNPVRKGETLTVTAHLQRPLSSAVTIGVRAYDASAQIKFPSFTDIKIPTGSIAGTHALTIPHDDDQGDESFTIAIRSLPSHVKAGNPDSAVVTIYEGVTSPVVNTVDDGSGGSGSNGDEQENHAPTVGDVITNKTVHAGTVLTIDLSDTFNDLDGDPLDYKAASSDETMATVTVDEELLTLRGVLRGPVGITVTATDSDGDEASQTFAVSVTGPTTVWYLPPVSDSIRQGFVRVLNHSDTTGVATLTPTDDAGRVYEPLTLVLEPRQAVRINAKDLENGNPDKRLMGRTGPGKGAWRLVVDSKTLDIEALAFVYTDDGFISSMNSVVRLDDDMQEIPFFNPGSEIDQVSRLRLVNPSEEDAVVMLTGTDDTGRSPGKPVRLAIRAGTTCTVDASQLESGAGLACGEAQDGIGDGVGNWRLMVTSTSQLVAMNLLADTAGRLSNLSGEAAQDRDDIWRVLLFPAANDTYGRQGVVRVVNRSAKDGTVRIKATDDADTIYDTLALSINSGETVHVNSDDLEFGNVAKDLKGSTGTGMGSWRLDLSNGAIEFEAHAYLRTSDGFLTAMNATAPHVGTVSRIAFFNAGDDTSVSVLRLVNGGAQDAVVAIDGTDDLGFRPGTTVWVTVPATDAVELTAAQLESGEADAIKSGGLGDGVGRWQLRIEGAVTAMNLLSSPTGHLTNLSRADPPRWFGVLPAALLPPSATVMLEIVEDHDHQLRGRWTAVESARYDVDLLRNGKRFANLSKEGTRSTSIRWWYRHSSGTYTLRVRSVNADGVRGPWSGLSNEIVFD